MFERIILNIHVLSWNSAGKNIFKVDKKALGKRFKFAKSLWFLVRFLSGGHYG